MKTSLPIIRNGKKDKIYEVQVNTDPLGKKPRWLKLGFRYTLSSAVKYVKSLIGFQPHAKPSFKPNISEARKINTHFELPYPCDLVLESKHFRIIIKVEYTTQILTVIDHV